MRSCLYVDKYEQYVDKFLEGIVKFVECVENYVEKVTIGFVWEVDHKINKMNITFKFLYFDCLIGKPLISKAF